MDHKLFLTCDNVWLTFDLNGDGGGLDAAGHNPRHLQTFAKLLTALLPMAVVAGNDVIIFDA